MIFASLKQLDRLQFLALHANAITGGDEFNTIDIELLQEGSDAGDVAFLVFLAQDFADILARKRSVVANDAARAHLVAVVERRRPIQFDYLAVAADIAHMGSSSPTDRPNSARSPTLLHRRFVPLTHHRFFPSVLVHPTGPLRRVCCKGRVPATSSPHRAPRRYSQDRSEEHTSDLQSRGHLVCRLL